MYTLHCTWTDPLCILCAHNYLKMCSLVKLNFDLKILRNFEISFFELYKHEI